MSASDVKNPGRRDFVRATVGSGFAAAVLPVTAETIKTDSQDLLVGEVMIPVGGFQMPAYRAAPAGGTNLPVVLVISEIFGVHEHIADVARRFAKQGYLAIAPELFVRQGDAGEYGEIAKLWNELVTKVPDAQVMADLDATVAWARTRFGADAVADLRQQMGFTGETIRREGAPIPLKPLPRWDNGRDVVLAGDAAHINNPLGGMGMNGRHVGRMLDAVKATPEQRSQFKVGPVRYEGKEIEFYADVIFLNASALNSAWIMMNSVSKRFPNGFGNDSDQLGRKPNSRVSTSGASAVSRRTPWRRLCSTPNRAARLSAAVIAATAAADAAFMTG